MPELKRRDSHKTERPDLISGALLARYERSGWRAPALRWSRWASGVTSRYATTARRDGGPITVFARPVHHNSYLLMLRQLLPQVNLSALTVHATVRWGLSSRPQQTMDRRQAVPLTPSGSESVVERFLGAAPTLAHNAGIALMSKPGMHWQATWHPAARSARFAWPLQEPVVLQSARIRQRLAATGERPLQQISASPLSYVRSSKQRREEAAFGASPTLTRAAAAPQPAQTFSPEPMPAGRNAQSYVDPFQAPRGVASQVNVNQITDEVVRQLDRRMVAWRERLGRI